MSKIDPNNSIPAFYAGKSVFITGATGFMGKILVEKLLRSCPEVREIFVLLRPKKGFGVDDRLRKLLSLPVFDKLRKDRPSVFDKLIPIVGNTADEGLGIPDIERRVLIERVSVVFHVAASVRFDDSLKEAIFLNTRSTRDMCILAAQMKNLKVFVHVSTTYCQADKPDVEERVYSFDVDWKKTITIAEKVDDRLLKPFTAKYLDNFPNTYTFTKRLAEQVVSDYSHAIPCVIFRPSIVVSSLEEPMPGWIDNFNGPVGMLIGGGKGILRILFGDQHLNADFIPVDIATKAMLTASWKRGLIPITADPSVHVYNCASADVKSVSFEELNNMGMRVIDKYPLEGNVWRPGAFHTKSKTVYYLLVLLLHLLPGMVIDTILKFSGRKPMLVNLHRKIYSANSALAHFLMNQWNFQNAKMRSLLSDVPPADVDTFGYEYATFDANRYFKNCLIAAKQFLLKEDLANLPAARLHYERMVWVDRIFKTLFAAFMIWLSIRSGLVNWMLSTLDSSSRILTGT
ncbi:putative fatty acyl-CoA reductase CG5065 [Diachasma alloeum]|uniref:putative fatty acyl-CoA reductase CG5065 n=1 Tax=Diachasma alloeum TaxID=454923 RepID=UPI00073827E7|nr:putative fatty acyl-CoA reductase CG5065 [Diachasma alloeum]